MPSSLSGASSLWYSHHDYCGHKYCEILTSPDERRSLSALASTPATVRSISTSSSRTSSITLPCRATSPVPSTSRACSAAAPAGSSFISRRRACSRRSFFATSTTARMSKRFNSVRTWIDRKIARGSFEDVQKPRDVGGTDGWRTHKRAEAPQFDIMWIKALFLRSSCYPP